MTVIMIAHRPSVMAVADKMMVLEFGAITKFGPRTDVIAAIAPEARAVADSRGSNVIRIMPKGDA